MNTRPLHLIDSMNASPVALGAPTVQAALLWIVLLLSSAPARALNFTVTSLADSGPGSLRGQLAQAALFPGADTISFSVTGTITLTSGEVEIEDHVTIAGPGARLLTIARSDAADTAEFGLLAIRGTLIRPLTASLAGLTLRNGYDFSSGAVQGNFADLTVTGCTFAQNFSFFDGGAISVTGQPQTRGRLVVRGCAFLENACGEDGNGVAPNGGACYAVYSDVVIENCTFYRNRANSGAAVAARLATTRITSCTFAENTVYNRGTVASTLFNFGVPGAAYAMTLENNILQTPPQHAPVEARTVAQQGDPGPAEVISHGFNLTNVSSGHLTHAADRDRTDPRLDPAGPQDRGGPTPLIALLAGSPAADGGKSFDLTTDQRGAVRPLDLPLVTNAPNSDGSDIGAYEAPDVLQSGPDFTVTTTADHDDGLAGGLDCTLREAWRAAGGTAEPAVITFAPGVTGVIRLDPALGPLPAADGAVHLAGPGARLLAVSGELGVRPLLTFSQNSGGSEISGLALRDATRTSGAGSDGAGLVNEAAPSSRGPLVLTECALTGFSATGLAGSQPGQAGGRARGAAIFNSGALLVRRCTFSGNSVRGGAAANQPAQFGSGGAGGEALGAALYNGGTGVLAAENCTFLQNTGTGGNGGSNTNFAGGNGGRGFGAVCNAGTATFTACTFTLNTGTGGTGGQGNNLINHGTGGAGCGGLTSPEGSCTVRNTISAGNAGAAASDVFGAFTSGGHNLIGKSNNSIGFTAAGDQAGTIAAPRNALLSAPVFVAGPTVVYVPGSGSPALDAGRRFGLETDQRFLPRTRDDPALTNAPGGDGTDIGAAETHPAHSGPAQIVSIRRIGAAMHLRLRGPAFASWQLQQSASLTSGLGQPAFQNTGAPQTADSLGLADFTDYGPLPARRFYRAGASP